MWLQARVLAFTKRHATTPTLSVYVTGRLSAPTMRSAARVVMRQQIEAARATRHVDGGAPELFEQCVTLLDEHLPSDAALHRLGTWFCFVTASGDVVSGSVPDVLDASVSWDIGPAIVPLLAAGVPAPAFVLLIDQEHARLYRIEDEGLVTLHSEEIEPLGVEGDHMGAQPRQGYHHGTTGETLTERTQRRRRAKRERFQSSVRRLVESTVGDSGVLVVGGSDEAAHAFVHALAAPVARRTVLAAELRFEAGSVHAATEARAALHGLADRDLCHWFDVLREERLGAGRSASGPPDVERALAHGDVAQLVLSQTFARRHARGAHHSVLRAIAEGGEVYVASLDAANRLDAKASGVAAELRFALPPT